MSFLEPEGEKGSQELYWAGLQSQCYGHHLTLWGASRSWGCRMTWPPLALQYPQVGGLGTEG